MVTITATNETVPSVTGASETATPTGIYVLWDEVAGFDVEVYIGSSASTFATSDFVGIGTANSFFIALSEPGTYKVYLRHRSPAGFFGAVYTSSNITFAGVGNSFLKTPTANVGSVSTSVSNGGSSGTVSSYNTWQQFNFVGFTAGNNSIYTFYIGAGITISGVSVTGSQILAVNVRARLYDQTNSADVPGGVYFKRIYYNNAGSSYGGLTSLVDFSESLISGFRGFLVPGNNYRVYLDVQKLRVFGTPTATVSVDLTYDGITGAGSFPL